MRNKTVIENYEGYLLVAKRVMWIKSRQWHVTVADKNFYADTAQGALSKAREYIKSK